MKINENDELHSVVQFTPTVDEVSSPDQGPQKTAVPYADRAEKRQRVDAVKGASGPLGGAPPIPEGKMGQLLGLAKPSFQDDELQVRAPPAARPISGVGSAYDVNQAISKGEVADPISLRAAKQQGLGGVANQKPMSKESLEAMQKVKETVEAEGLPQHDLEPIEKEFVEEGKEATPIPFNIEDLISHRNALLSDDRKKEIEGRLIKLRIEDLVVHKEIQQTVPIVPNKFEVTLRTFSQREHLWILQYLYEFAGSPRYTEELLNTFKLVLSIVAINNALLPDHRSDIGTMKEDVEREKFKKKMFHIASFPVQMIADFGVQCNWFNERVNVLFTYENVKNG